MPPSRRGQHLHGCEPEPHAARRRVLADHELGGYTTAHGDQLFSNFVGVGVGAPPNVTFSGSETFRGGAGRFTHAIGSAAMSGSATLTSQTGDTGKFDTLGLIDL